MQQLAQLDPVDYLVIGHLTCDITPTGNRLGGTAAFAALTARALGMRVGIVTAWGEDIPLGPLRHFPIVNFPTERSTTFENINTSEGRVQLIHHAAPNLGINLIPDPWRNAAIVHLGPVAQEVEPTLVRSFPAALLGITPQGWLRAWDAKGRVFSSEWPESAFVLNRAGATVVSLEDLDGDESRIEEMAASCHILAVTEAQEGSRLFWNGDVRRFRAPKVKFVEDTGAGDIYAAAFFTRLFTTRDPWEAARFATQLAAYSVTRPGLEAIPTLDEIEECTIEVY